MVRNNARAAVAQEYPDVIHQLCRCLVDRKAATAELARTRSLNSAPGGSTRPADTEPELLPRSAHLVKRRIPRAAATGQRRCRPPSRRCPTRRSAAQHEADLTSDGPADDPVGIISVGLRGWCVTSVGLGSPDLMSSRLSRCPSALVGEAMPSRPDVSMQV